MSVNTKATGHFEPHLGDDESKLNWLRASVLGANDGIISTAGLVIGVAGATESISLIFTAGMAGVIAGAVSMAAGEYVSVSTSRDTERALLAKEKFELANYPEQELEELTTIYEKKGLNRKTAQVVAKELTARDAFGAHVEAELHIDPQNLTSPWQAAFASAISFVIGAVLPLIAVLIPPVGVRIPFTFSAVIIALILTGTLSAKIGKSGVSKAVIRVVTGGVLAMAFTYGIGQLFNVNGLVN